MPLPEVSQRHRELMAELITRWRRWANVAATAEPSLPYDDEDEPPDEEEKVVAQVLGRLIGALGQIDLETCRAAKDVDERLAALVHAELAKDTRPGALRAARLVLGRLRVPTTLPEPDRPSPDDAAA